MTEAKHDVVALSRGSVWAKEYIANPSNPWPSNGSATIVFRNTQGGLITTLDSDTVTATSIRFLADPEEIEEIPAGANFEVFVETDHGPVMIRYGRVLRKESRYYDAAATEQRTVPQVFVDSFQKAALGHRWEPIFGGARIYNNSGQALPNGVGANTGLFGNYPAGIRFWKQMSTDSIEATFTVVYPTILPPFLGANNGLLTFCFGSDIVFSTGLAVQLDTINNLVRYMRLTGTGTGTFLASAALPVANNDAFTVRYNDLTKTMAVYRNASTTPMITPWVDDDEELPKGNGYRHWGFLFNPTLLETGPQPTAVAVKDIV